MNISNRKSEFFNGLDFDGQKEVCTDSKTIIPIKASATFPTEDLFDDFEEGSNLCKTDYSITRSLEEIHNFFMTEYDYSAESERGYPGIKDPARYQAYLAKYPVDVKTATLYTDIAEILAKAGLKAECQVLLDALSKDTRLTAELKARLATITKENTQ